MLSRDFTADFIACCNQSDDEIIPLKARLVNLEAEKVRQDEELASKVKTAEESLQSAKDTLNAESILLR